MNITRSNPKRTPRRDAARQTRGQQEPLRTKEKDDKVREASRQFEAVLLRQIIGEARKTVVSSTANSQSSSAKIYDDMINNQMADSISRSGAFQASRKVCKPN